MNKLLTVALLGLLLAGCGTPATLPTAKTATRVSAQADLGVSRATSEIKTQLEVHYMDFYRQFESLSVSPTPLGTLFTFHGTVAENNLAGQVKRFQLTGTYNSLTREVKVVDKLAIAQ